MAVLSKDCLAGTVFLGELGLDGRIRAFLRRAQTPLKHWVTCQRPSCGAQPVVGLAGRDGQRDLKVRSLLEGVTMA